MLTLKAISYLLARLTELAYIEAGRFKNLSQVLIEHYGTPYVNLTLKVLIELMEGIEL